AAVIEGKASAGSYSWSTTAGPRTLFTLSDVRTHFGQTQAGSLQIATLGGPVSDARFLFIPELPRLTAETRYLVFLNNVDWFFTPVVGNYLFRLETGPKGTDVLIDPDGRAVLGVSEAGLDLTPDPVVDTTLDFLHPDAQPAILDRARPLLDGALSKEEFLAAIRDLQAIEPIHGEYRTLPTPGRIWDQIEAAEDIPASETAGS